MYIPSHFLAIYYMKKQDVKLYPPELTVKLMCIKKKKRLQEKKQVVSDLSLLNSFLNLQFFTMEISHEEKKMYRMSYPLY